MKNIIFAGNPSREDKIRFIGGLVLTILSMCFYRIQPLGISLWISGMLVWWLPVKKLR